MSRLATGAVSSTVRKPGSCSTAAGPTAPSVHDQVMVAASTMASAYRAMPARRRMPRIGERPRRPGRLELPRRPAAAAASSAADETGPGSVGTLPQDASPRRQRAIQESRSPRS